MAAERAGYTVTMFVVDVSPSMSKMRTLDVPNGLTKEVSSLKWGLQFVKLKIQEMIFNGRKTDQCGVILVGSEETDNYINRTNGGYTNVSEYIEIAHPNAGTLASLDALEPSSVSGDCIDGLIVAIETQHNYLAKKTWTRRIVLITDGESPLELEDWDTAVKRMNQLSIGLTVVGIDFDDADFPFKEENKSTIKRENEEFYHKFAGELYNGIIGTCEYALQEIARPDVKVTKSVLMGSILRLGDVSTPEFSLEIMVKTSKCTAVVRPKSWKKFSIRHKKNRFGKMEPDDDAMDVDAPPKKMVFNQLKQRTNFSLFDDKQKEKEAAEEQVIPVSQEQEVDRLDKDDLIRGFSYGTTHVPCPEGQFPRLETKKGIDICGFFKREHFKRELSMGEIQYVWADPGSSKQQVALSSLVQAMASEDLYAIARWVTKDGVDAKMGVLAPVQFEEVDCMLWAQMPFADDVRKYTFSSLENLVNKKGEVLTEHPYLPTEKQMDAMDRFIDAMDLSDTGGKDEEGNPIPWFDTRYSYNPALHRVKQAMFHCAVVKNLDDDPVPPPHPALLEYWNPPRRVMKRARSAINDCITEFAVKEVRKKVARTKKNEHVHANDEDDEPLLLDGPSGSTQPVSATQPKEVAKENDSATEDESEEEELLLENTKPEKIPKRGRTPSKKPVDLPPTPEQSPEPDPGRATGRIVGSTSPLKDFEDNLKEGDLVGKAVEDLAFVIKDIVKKPFSKRRSKELLECMRALRKTCREEDEVAAWNTFLMGLKEDCAGDPGNQQFWSEVQQQGRELSLISNGEVEEDGGESPFTDLQAEEFLFS